MARLDPPGVEHDAGSQGAGGGILMRDAHRGNVYPPSHGQRRHPMIPADKTWIDILQALLTPTIAFAAVTITVFQARINYLRFRHEMFDRRYDMYLAVRRFIREVTAIAASRDKTRKEYDEAARQYLDAIDGAPFIFNWSVDDYFIEILKRAGLFLFLARGFRTAGSVAGDSDEATVDDIKTWFDEQLGPVGSHSELDTRVGRFLHLRQV